MSEQRFNVGAKAILSDHDGCFPGGRREELSVRLEYQQELLDKHSLSELVDVILVLEKELDEVRGKLVRLSYHKEAVANVIDSLKADKEKHELFLPSTT